VLTESFRGSVDGDLESGVIRQVLTDLLRVVGVKDHADDAAGALLVDCRDLRVEVLAQELLLGSGVTQGGDRLWRDDCLLRHGHRDWHATWDGHLRGCLPTEGWERCVVDGDALLSWLLRLLISCALEFRAGVVLTVPVRVLLVCSSLVWILLRLVVAVRLILPWSTAPGLALLVVWLHGLALRLHGPLTHLALVLVVPTLVVIPVHPWLVRRVLLLILVPASASGGSWIAATLPETTLVVVASATLVAALTPAVPRLVVLVSLRVLS